LPLNQNFFGLFDMVDHNRDCRVGHQFFHHLFSQRIHQPGLPLGEVKGVLHRVGLKHLPGFSGVLFIQLHHFGVGESSARLETLP
jgi:hypothetical protein